MERLGAQIRGRVAQLRAALDNEWTRHATKQADRAYVNTKAGLTAAYASGASTAAVARDRAIEHGNYASKVAREQVYPTVKPYTDAAYKRVEPHYTKASELSRKHVGPYWRSLDERFDAATPGHSKLQAALSAALVLLLAVWLLRSLFGWLLAKPRGTVAARGARALKALPGVRGQVEKQISSTLKAVQAKLDAKDPPAEKLLQLPPAGLDADSVLNELEARAENDLRYSDGESRASGTIYMTGDAHRDLLNDTYCMFSQANPLHADLFPSIRRMEAEVLAMTADLVGGGAAGVPTVRTPSRTYSVRNVRRTRRVEGSSGTQVCGAMTGGGSESLVTALLASVAHAKTTRGVMKPEIVVADSAHAAVYKAARACGAELIVIKVDPKSFRLTGSAVRRYISRNTAVVVASAYSFPHGIVDDVEDVASVCAAAGVSLHVDACLGGFVLPFARRLGLTVPKFDFALPGVTSLSVDHHKYGQAHKGTSAVLYRTPERRHSQFTAVTDWSGGLYISPGLSGSRSGGLIATAWATMRHNGQQGYQDAVKEILRAARAFREAVATIEELQVLGDSAASVVAFTSTTPKAFNIYQLGSLLQEKGWHYISLIKPAGLHFCFTLQHVAGVDAQVADLRACCDELRKATANGSKSELSEHAKVYGLADAAVDRDSIGEVLMQIEDVFLQP